MCVIVWKWVEGVGKPLNSAVDTLLALYLTFSFAAAGCEDVVVALKVKHPSMMMAIYFFKAL